ncbi:MAG: hypothetical protein M3Y07_01295 [Acidobacteriota bacterium]|nr:hypothetical protein [Acidobacteriota bacterium]
MPKDSQSGRTRPPKDYALSPPPQQPGSPHALTQFILPIVPATRRELGQLSQTVATLSEDSKDTREKLDRISHIVYAVGVVGTILLAVLVFLANEIADALIAGLKTR